MDGFLWDLRHAWRGLLRTPGFTVVAVLTLALGIGANTAIFTLLDEVFLRPLPIHAPEKLFQVVVPRGQYFSVDFSYPEFADLAGLHGQPRPVAGSSVFFCALSSGERAFHVYGEQVTGGYFGLLGAPMTLGRPLTPLDDRPGAPLVVVLSHDLWRTKFGADPNIVGRTIHLDRMTATVAGVAGPGFRGTLRGFPAAIWAPVIPTLAFTVGDDALDRRTTRWLVVFVRSSREDVPATTQTLLSAWRSGGGDGVAANDKLVLRPAGRGDPGLLAGPGRLSRMLMALVLLLLAIATANVAGLLLARTETRRREIAIRLALGSGAVRLARQFLLESLLLAFAGGAAGMFVAAWTFDLLKTFTPPSPWPLELNYRLDIRTLLFGLGVTMLAGLSFGIVPVLQARGVDLMTAMKRDAGAGWWSRRRFEPRRMLVAGQVALSVLLLTAAGLFLRTLWNERAVPLGFEPNGRFAVSVDLGAAGLDREGTLAFYRELLARVRSLPGIESATAAQYLPLSPGGSTWGYGRDDLGPGTPEMEFNVVAVGDDYFRTTGIRLLSGRSFTAEESFRAGAPRQLIVDREVAARLWPGQNPVGRTIHFPDPTGPFEVIGMSEKARMRTLRGAATPTIFLSTPNRQSRDLTLIVNSRGSAPPFAAIAALVSELNPRVALFEPTTLEQHVAQATVESRFGAMLLGAFGLLALGLTGLGLYGLLAFAVTRRTREIGLRLAFGATPGRVLRMIVSESVAVALPGFVAGLALALGLSRLVSSLLYGVSPTDPAVYAAMVTLMALALLLAAWLPGRRAALLEPMMALREE